ncbi:MAG TPA: hypothetical protein VNO75_05925 [Gemmatimonadaceae bacterium]|nr:hypothetical protein [Gemmatimonadaceae bacterium]
MAYKIFEGPDGTKWEVWLVVPTEAERRRGERRASHRSSALTYTGPERRVGPDRRTKLSGGRTVVAVDFESGWLCFESDQGEKRRLAPVPTGWDAAEKERLWDWCEAATVVVKCGPRREELGPDWPPIKNND